MSESGFVDLRQSGSSHGVHDSFWPSFTDVMMVVVLIFLMTTMVLVVRNWELVAELRATIELEREASALVLSTSETNETLSEKLANAEHRLSELRMQLMRTEELSQQRMQTLTRKNQQISAQRRENQALQAEQSEQARRLAEIESTSEAQKERLTQPLSALASAEALQTRQAEEFASLKQTNIESAQILAQLQGDYDGLKVKYDKLIRPARSAKGKFVVEVRYEKKGKYHHINYKDPGASKYTAASRAKLDKHLSRLKAAHPNDLYIKIIIPSNSGLSYSEAWSFTSDILDKYDYYHQDNTPAPTAE